MTGNKFSPLPGFLLNTIPKSGTHLVKQILLGIPNMRHDPNKGVFEHLNPKKAQYINLLESLPTNEFVAGHIFYTTEWKNLLQQLQIKQIFVQRDPRDIVVSLSYFILKAPLDPLHELFKQMTQKQRICTLIKGIETENIRYPNIRDWYMSFYGWHNDNRTLTLKFEDLISNNLPHEVDRIIDFLWSNSNSPLPKRQLREKMIQHINPEKSVTFRKGKVGGWRKEFDKDMVDLFQQYAGDLLIDSGYSPTDG